jgi:hypothetical protein
MPWSSAIITRILDFRGASQSFFRRTKGRTSCWPVSGICTSIRVPVLFDVKLTVPPNMAALSPHTLNPQVAR